MSMLDALPLRVIGALIVAYLRVGNADPSASSLSVDIFTLSDVDVH